jgi:replication initiation and membrane attachment protein
MGSSRTVEAFSAVFFFCFPSLAFFVIKWCSRVGRTDGGAALKITNMLHFTEQHRFCVYRDFAQSSLDMKMLSTMYQPMIGGFAVALYHTLYGQLSGEKIGYSPMEQQRRLFMSLELEGGERGRKFMIEQTSKLEAVGLLQTNRRYLAEDDDYIYEYRLFQPMSPNEFFRNQHLTLLLRDKVGKYVLLSLRDELLAPEPTEWSGAQTENVSVPFYDLFRLNTQVVDMELEQAMFEASAARQENGRMDVSSKGFAYTDILLRFPKVSPNRVYIENLKYEPEQLASINIAAKKYGLSLLETCRLLSEDGVFAEDGKLEYDLLQYRANLLFRQGKKRDEERERVLARADSLSESRDTDGAAGNEGPENGKEKQVEMAYYLDVPQLLQSECNGHQYNFILRNEPYTFVLKKFFPQGEVPGPVHDMMEKVDLNYKLPEEVINVMIHYIHTARRSWAKSSIEATATDMLGKQVNSYEAAVDYVRERMRYMEKAAAQAASIKSGGGKGRAGSAGGAGKSAKPHIPIIQDASKPTGKLTEEELNEIRLEAKKLDEKFRNLER